MSDNHGFSGKAWFHIQGGKQIWFLEPDPFTLPWDELVTACSRECRFANQIDQFYSVLEHSCLVALILELQGRPRWEQKQGMLHDLPEGCIRDVPSPLSNHPEMKFYRKVRDDLIAACCEHEVVPNKLSESVHLADRMAFQHEVHHLVPDRHPDWALWMRDSANLDADMASKIGPPMCLAPRTARSLAADFWDSLRRSYRPLLSVWGSYHRENSIVRELLPYTPRDTWLW